MRSFSILRASLYEDEDRRAAYQKATWPVTFLFAADDAAAEEPLSPTPTPRHIDGRSELHLQDAMRALGDAIRQRFVPTNTATTASSSSSSSTSTSSPTAAAAAAAGSGAAEFPNATILHNITAWYNTSGVYDDWERILELQNNETYQVATRDAVYGEPASFDRCARTGV